MRAFRLWAAARKLRRQERLHRSGFDYAISQIMFVTQDARDAVVDRLEVEAGSMEPDAFDRGIRDAIRDYRNWHGIVVHTPETIPPGLSGTSVTGVIVDEHDHEG